MPHDGAKARFHKKFANQQNGNSYQHAGVTIFPNQGIETFEVEHRSD